MPVTTSRTTSAGAPVVRRCSPRLTNIALLVFVHLHIAAARTTRDERRCRGERGQATTEYALVLLAAALVGLMVVAWATAGGGAARISRLFNSVIDAVIDRV